MGCNCKGKNEGADLQFFKALDEALNLLGGRPPEQIKKDFTIATKAKVYDKLIQLAQFVESLKS